MSERFYPELAIADESHEHSDAELRALDRMCACGCRRRFGG